MWTYLEVMLMSTLLMWQCTVSLVSSDTQGRGGEGGGRPPLPARAGRDGAADPVRVAGALKL